MPKTAMVTDGAALHILHSMTGLDLADASNQVPADTRDLLADQLGATVIRRPVDVAGVDVARATGLTDRVTDPQFGAWLDHAARAKGCTMPVRLAGTSTTINASTGEVVGHFDTANLPDGVLYKPCGNRREKACPACSQVYKYDTYQLIKAGMAGGKGVPESVAQHPAIFLTLTAPSFGPVHARGQRKHGGPITACRPHFRTKPVCPHGRPLYCAAKHAEADRRVGTPLCPDCYNHDAHAVWNLFAPQLWTRTAIAWSRAAAKIGKAHGEQVRIRYAKVAEFQSRGLVHFHALLRLDGHDPDAPSEILPPPACITAQAFKAVIEDAVAGASLATPAHPDTGGSWLIEWGSQIDARVVRTGLADDQLTEGHVAGYLAKYATKATEATGLSAGRLNDTSIDYYADPDGTHTARLIDAAWTLGRPDPQPSNNPGEFLPGPFEGLRRGGHQYGFAGHFSTKSQRYSTTLTRLRNARRVAAIRGSNPDTATVVDLSDEEDTATTIVLSDWSYRGTGWRTTADAALALFSAAAARERRPAGATNND